MGYSEDCEDLVPTGAAVWQRRYGTGSILELSARLSHAFELDGIRRGMGEQELLCARVEHEHVTRYGARQLATEADDERQRDAALDGDRALVAYERKWAGSISVLQRRHPSRWRLPGLSDEELRDELTLRLVAALRGDPCELRRHCRAGKAWGLVFLAHERSRLRRDFRLNIVLADPPLAFERQASGEEALIEHEHATVRERARARAESTLSRPQRDWYAAMRTAANAEHFFEASGKLNLSEAARARGKNRSTATRAFAELTHVFSRELAKLGG